MFANLTRTETVNGCRFYEQDMLMLDYSYHGDTEIHCSVDYDAPGFGFVIAENSDNIFDSENVYVVKFGARNEYQVYQKEYLKQNKIRDGFIQPGKNVDIGTKNLNLIFKFEEGHRIEVYSDNIMLISLGLPNEIDNYKIGFYSNAGNTLKWAVVYSETPTNWISNIWNSQGGNIDWITNGFKIQDCLYPCDVECQNNELAAGTYYFDFLKENADDLEYYIYPTSKKVELKNETRGPWRYMDKDSSVLTKDGEKLLSDPGIIDKLMDDMSEHKFIMDTRFDKENNILDYKSMSFKLEEPTAINIKFRGTHGTVTNIAIKKYKEDNFVATKFGETEKNPSYITLDLSEIKKAEIITTIQELPSNETQDKHAVIENEHVSYTVRDLDLQLNKEYKYVIDSEKRIVKANNNDYEIGKNDDILIMFKNMNAIITSLIIYNYSGEKIDVLMQRTFKITIPATIVSPIIVENNKGEIYNISSAYREVCEDATQLDVFNRYNEIKLSKSIVLNKKVIIAGTVEGGIDTNAESIEKAVKVYSIVPESEYEINYKNNTIKVKQDTRKKYKYIIVEYPHCDNYKYEFTNWQRQLVDLKKIENIYLEYPICNTLNNIIIYGIKKNSLFNIDKIYRIKDNKSINLIDYCVDIYEELLGANYSVSSTGKVVIDTFTREKYEYLIIDYLKNNSYAINEKNAKYEVDIASSDDEIKVYYDNNGNGVTEQYSKTNIDINDIAMENNFIVLNKGVRV